jgi:hypothetical protein
MAGEVRKKRTVGEDAWPKMSTTLPQQQRPLRDTEGNLPLSIIDFARF